MISQQAETPEAGRRRSHDLLDDAARIRTAVDMVAERHQPFLALEIAAVFGNQRFEIAQLVDATMDVADGVDGGGPGVKGKARMGHGFSYLIAGNEQSAHCAAGPAG